MLSSLRTRAGAITWIPILVLWFVWALSASHISTGQLDILGRYSVRYFGLLVTFFVVSVVLTLVLWKPPVILFRLQGRFTHPGWTLLFAIVGGVLWGINLEPIAKVFPTTLLLLAALWLLPRDTTDSDTAKAWRILRWVLPTLLIIGLALQLAAILWLPYIHSHDEGAYSQIAIDFLDTGRLSGDLYGYPPRHFVGFGWWLATLAGWYEVFGFGWLTGRLYTVVLSTLALVVIFFAGTKLQDWKTGLLAATVMGLSPTFVYTHQIRPDAPMLLMVSLIVLAYITTLDGRKPWQYFVLGAVGMLSLEVHLLGMAFWGVAGGLLGLQWLEECWKARRPVWSPALFWFVLGSLIPLLVFVVTHLVPDLGQPAAIMVTPGARSLMSKVSQELSRWAVYVDDFPLEFLITLGAIGLALYRWEARDRMLLGWVWWLLLAYIVIAPTVYPQYTRYFLPLQALLIARALTDSRKLVPARYAFFVSVLLVGLLFGVTLRVIEGRPAGSGLFERTTPPIMHYVENTIPEGEVLVMSSYYYMYQSDPHRYVFRVPGVHPPTIEGLGGPAEPEVFRVLAPALIVLDARFDEHTPWIDSHVEEAEYITLTEFEDDGLDVYLRKDLAEFVPGS